MHINQLKPALEAILFLQHKPLPLSKLSETIDETIEAETYKAALESLMEDYRNSAHGIELAEVAGGYVFRTKIEHRDMLRRMLQITPVRMSQAILEALAIVAFHQPVTREQLEEIRGVECGHHLRNLMEKKLVRMVGRSDAVGKPMLYGTTKEFLELFGLPSLQEMPTLREIEDMLPKNEVGEAEDEERRIRGELQNIVANSQELEFSDIELEEQRLFGDDEESETEKDSDGSPAQDSAAARGSQAAGAEHQSDEVAGTVAYGSLLSRQEAEWESDAPATAQSGKTRSSATANAANKDDSDDENDSDGHFTREAGTAATLAEDHRQRRDHEPEES